MTFQAPSRPSPRGRGFLAYLALLYAAGLLGLTGLIPGWGRWYSADTNFRAQTDALLEGRLALSDSPTDLAYDRTWSARGVHQIWGLGVPLTRLPFEVLARVWGQTGFPDRWVMAGVMALVAGALLCLWLPADWRPPARDPLDPAGGGHVTRERTAAGGLLVVLLFFPPVVTLLRCHIGVFEEVTVYVYYWAIGLLAAALAFLRHPNGIRGLLLGGGVGLCGFVRPTLLAYGVAALAIAGGAVWRRERQARRPGALGRTVRRGWPALTLSLLGVALLYLSNSRRFGAGSEFGHQLTVNDLHGSLLATRFGHPFAQEPLLAASKELFGALFLAGGRFNPALPYAAGVIPWQSPTVRYRQFYFDTFDAWVLVLTLTGWFLSGASGFLGRASRATGAGQERHVLGNLPSPGVLALWSFGGAAMLFGFYLRYPTLASRYLMDFAPAFAAAIGAAWLEAMARRRSNWSAALLLAVLIVGTTGQVATAKVADLGFVRRSVSWAELASTRTDLPRHAPPTPAGHRRGDSPTATGIPFNGSGWDAATGQTRPVCIFIVSDPEWLEVELEPASGAADPQPPEYVRAKIGLEPLRKLTQEKTPTGWRVRFSGPSQSSGWQALFLALVRPEELSAAASPWRLTRVQWRPDGSTTRGESLAPQPHPLP